ncbi:MAG: F0F1 ATP synthase subunit epsilon [Mangrovicoccus sp.]
MADTLQFDLVSPERSLASFPATSVQLPGSEGDMTAMPNHAPTITTLRPGVITVAGEGETQEFVVTGGFADISASAATILAEAAYPRGAEAAAALRTALDEAKASAEAASDDTRDVAEKLVADLVHLLEAME